MKSILITILNEGIVDCPYDFGIPRDGGRRTLKRQKELYAKGRTAPGRKVTWTLNSKHMKKQDGYGHAFDLYAYVDGKASWDLKYLEPIARHLQTVARSHGVNLVWGQDAWGKDGAHMQFGDYEEA